ncbi:MAG TPA: efflux RND transporter periplasmic adaptor subunit, partial [Thermoanaerobaculia bacterium]|nr:efflux RND transporter periplasmic adaptor subunit [Thermoanaerobaculia bacterium]
GQGGFRRGAAGEAGAAGSAPSGGNRGRGGFGAGTRVWVLENGKPASKWVRTGATDGQVTEVFGDELRPGQEVIVDISTATAAKG